LSLSPTDNSFVLQQALMSGEKNKTLGLGQRVNQFSQQGSAFTDLNSLQGIRQQGKEDQGAALEQIAKQFESILVQSMMKAMRQANSAFSEDSMFNTSEMQFHQDMLDQQLGLSLSQGRGVGLADALVRQLKQQYQADDTQVSADVGALDKAVEYKRWPASDKSAAASDGMSSGLGLKLSAASSPQEFLAAIEPFARQAAKKLGVDEKVLMAQAALETGWGKHVIHDEAGNNTHNLFNIKADQRWSGSSVSVPTLEYTDGLAKKEMAAFRRYDSYGQSFADYVEFLQGNGRYQEALGSTQDSKAFITSLQEAGYATDPAYAEKIINIFDGPHFSERFLNKTLGDLAKSDLEKVAR